MFGFHNINGDKVSIQRLKLAAQDDRAIAELARDYRRYVCPECREHHTSESSAEDCCAPDIDVVWVLDGVEYDTPADLVEALKDEEPAMFCPVCSASHADAEDATECCLWKTHGPAQRFTITKAVERGASWPDAIAAATKGV